MKRNLKGIMGVLLSATLFAGAVAASPAIAGTSADILVKADENTPDGAVTYIYGDVDLNNKLEAVDALAILKHVVKLTTLDGELVLELADVDHDASIAAADALAVLKCVVGLQQPSYYTVTPPASEVPPATESANPESPAPSEMVMPTETVAPTEVPTPDVTETPTASDPVEPTETPDVTETPAPTATPDVTETVVPTETPDVTVQPTDTPEPTVQPTDTPKPTETPDVTETPKPTASVEPTPDVTIEPTKTPMPTETVKPTVTPTETPAPHVHNYTSEVTLEATCGKDGVETFTCECGDTFTKPIPATGEHTYEKTEEKLWIIDKAAYDEVITKKTMWECTCGERFDSIAKLEEHQFPLWDANIPGHGGHSVVYIPVHEIVHHKEVGHYENAVSYKCGVCDAVKEYSAPETCTHEWYVKREAYDEQIVEYHLFCKCGFDCGLYDRNSNSSELSKKAQDIYLNHYLSLVELDPETGEIVDYDEMGENYLAHYAHMTSKAKDITVTCHHDATYRCSLCGTYKDAE